jgi:putative flippase GtrA
VGVNDTTSPLHPPPVGGQVLRFATIGVGSTLAYFGLYAALRTGIGAQPSNAAALLTTAIANTAANRRFTFAVRGTDRVVRDQLGGLVAFGVALALTSGSLALVHALAADPSRMQELTVLAGSNVLATVLRFVLLRAWVLGLR